MFALLCLSFACTDVESKNVSAAAPPAGQPAANAAPRGATIDIEQGGPADTVRKFYSLLREKKFREALFLTNLRPAIESLTDSELKEFSIDFETIANQIPTEIEINGEIVSGDSATVTANLPDPDEDGQKKIQQIKLEKQGDAWVIETADPATEARIKAEGKNYFNNLRIETHEDEAQKMLERVAKAEVAYSLQNNNACADMETLIGMAILPPDIRTSDSTGYKYVITVTPDKKRYFATATPAEYGKSGKRSFLLQIDPQGLPHVTGTDNGGKPLKQ